MKSLLLTAMILLALVTASYAQTATVNVDATVTYTEPTTVDDGTTPMKSLDHTTIYAETYDEGGVVLDQWSVDVPATAATGGGAITQNITQVINLQSKQVKFWASATNNIGESVKAGPVVKDLVIPDVQVPNVPLNLSVTVTINVMVSQ